MKNLKKALALLLALLMVISMAACAGKTETEAPKETDAPSAESPKEEKQEEAPVAEDPSETGVLRLQWTTAEGSTDKFGFAWYSPHYSINMIFDALLSIESADGSYIPHIASDWTVSDDGTTYVFTIREDAKWHDGEPVTIDDVLFSVNGYLKHPVAHRGAPLRTAIEGGEAYYNGEADTVSGISASGNELTIQLTAPRSDFLMYLTNIFILPEHLLGDVPIENIYEDPYWECPIGSGPYKIAEMNAPDYYVAERADTWYGEPAGIKTIVCTSYIDDPNAAYIAGEVDGIMSMRNSATMEALCSSNPDLTGVMVPSNYARMFVWNTTDSEDGKHNMSVNNVAVRKALMMALDKEGIAAFYGELGTPLTTMVSSESKWYNTDIPLFERNTEKAKQILDEEGFDYDTPIRIGYYYTDETTQNVMALIAQNWAEIGVKTEPFPIVDTYEVVNQQKNYEIYYMGSSGIDPMAVAYGHVNLSTNALSQDAQGDTERKAEMIDTYYNMYFTTTDPEVQKEAMDQIQINALELEYLSPLYSVDMVYVYNSAKVYIPEEIFALASLECIDYHFEDWKLLQ